MSRDKDDQLELDGEFGPTSRFQEAQARRELKRSEAEQKELPKLRVEHEEYTQTMLQLWMLASLIGEMPLAEVWNMQERAETIGPLVDPTLYRLKGQALSEDKALVRAALTFQKGIIGMRQRWEKERK